jgi:hypothetical protein
LRSLSRTLGTRSVFQARDVITKALVTSPAPYSIGPKSGFHFCDQSDASILERRIVRKSGPTFPHDALARQAVCRRARGGGAVWQVHLRGWLSAPDLGWGRDRHHALRRPHEAVPGSGRRSRKGSGHRRSTCSTRRQMTARRPSPSCRPTLRPRASTGDAAVMRKGFISNNPCHAPMQGTIFNIDGCLYAEALEPRTSPCACLRSLSPVQTVGTGLFRAVCWFVCVTPGQRAARLRVCRPYAIPIIAPGSSSTWKLHDAIRTFVRRTVQKNSGAQPGTKRLLPSLLLVAGSIGTLAWTMIVFRMLLELPHLLRRWITALSPQTFGIDAMAKMERARH